MAAASQAEKEELACTYAALILHDAAQVVTASAINKLADAAGVHLQGFWPNLFERVLKEKKLDDLMASAGSVGGGGGGGGGSAAPAPAAAAKGGSAPAAAPKAEEKPEVEEKEETEEEIGFDLFG